MHAGDGFFSASGAAILSLCPSHTEHTPVWEVSCPKLQGSQAYASPANKHFYRLFFWSPHLLSAAGWLTFLPPSGKIYGHKEAPPVSLCVSVCLDCGQLCVSTLHGFATK